MPNEMSHIPQPSTPSYSIRVPYSLWLAAVNYYYGASEDRTPPPPVPGDGTMEVEVAHWRRMEAAFFGDGPRHKSKLEPVEGPEEPEDLGIEMILGGGVEVADPLDTWEPLGYAKEKAEQNGLRTDQTAEGQGKAGEAG